MTQEEKQLILIDLCAREPYHPRINVFNQGYEGFQDGEFDTSLWLDHIDAFRFDRIEILPYLRPMSSMTEEEKSWYESLRNALTYQENGEYDLDDFNELNDFLNRKKLDRYGLIEKGLALEEPEEMYSKDK